MELPAIDNLLWAASFAGNLSLLLVLVLRRRASSFPFFTAFMCFQVLRTITLFIVSRKIPDVYYGLYYGLAAADYVLQLALIVEIARDVLRPTGTWVKDARRSFLLWSALAVAVAATLAFLMPHGTLTSDGVREMRASVFTSLLICEIFLAMISSANRLGLHWRTHIMALGQGLTAWALLALAGDLGDVAAGWHGHVAVLFDRARIVVYIGVLLFWIVSFWLPERKRAPLSADMQKYLVALHARLQYDLESVRPPAGTRP